MPGTVQPVRPPSAISGMVGVLPGMIRPGQQQVASRHPHPVVNRLPNPTGAAGITTAAAAAAATAATAGTSLRINQAD